MQRSTEKELHIPSEASLNFSEDLMQSSSLPLMIHMKTEILWTERATSVTESYRFYSSEIHLMAF